MEMKTTRQVGKWGLFLLTLWPAVYVFVFLVSVMDALFAQGLDAERVGNLMALHLGTIVLTIVLFVFYSVHLYQNRRVPGRGKMRWFVAFIFGNVVAMPLYWWWHLRPG